RYNRTEAGHKPESPALKLTADVFPLTIRSNTSGLMLQRTIELPTNSTSTRPLICRRRASVCRRTTEPGSCRCDRIGRRSCTLWIRRGTSTPASSATTSAPVTTQSLRARRSELEIDERLMNQIPTEQHEQHARGQKRRAGKRRPLEQHVFVVGNRLRN